METIAGISQTYTSLYENSFVCRCCSASQRSSPSFTGVQMAWSVQVCLVLLWVKMTWFVKMWSAGDALSPQRIPFQFGTDIVCSNVCAPWTTVWHKMFFTLGCATSNADKEHLFLGEELRFEKCIIERAENSVHRPIPRRHMYSTTNYLTESLKFVKNMFFLLLLFWSSLFESLFQLLKWHCRTTETFTFICSWRVLFLFFFQVPVINKDKIVTRRRRFKPYWTDSTDMR